jgi:hypothetical protein
MSKKRVKKKRAPTVAKKTLHKQAWSLARAMMVVHAKIFDRSLCNKHVLCEVCNREYCQGFDGVDQYCIECPYKPYYVGELYMPNCQKELTGYRNCQKCGGVK